MTGLRAVVLTCFLFCVASLAQGQTTELRGIWMTPRVSSGFWSKAEIARAMDSLADNNFNVVYFNGWSRGWPLWRSELFFAETGYYTDPAAGERDILQEAIAEAHRRGLEIEPWMEYGFVSWWSGNSLPGYPKGPLLERHPDWVAKTYSGSDQFPSGDGGDFYWMSHNHPGVWDFMMRLHREIADTYDVDGIELDRIRYPQLDCGYDSATVAQYQAAFGTPPPSNVADAGWKRWRADRLIEFHRMMHDSITAAHPHVTVSNAPSHYSSSSYYSAYETFLQDWRAWLNNRSLDAAQIQMYVPPYLLGSYITSALNGVTDSLRPRAYAGIAAKTSDYTLTGAQTLDLITTVRNSGMQGNSFWYYNDLRDLGYLPLIKAQRYQSKVAVPFRREGWRMEGSIGDESGASRSAGWTVLNLPPASAIVAWNRNLVYAGASTNEWIEYGFDIAASAYYEVYAFQVGGLLNLTTRAPYQLFGYPGDTTKVLVNQSAGGDAGWVKLGDLYLQAGSGQTVVRLTNDGIGSGKYVAGDAVMLILNRRLSPDAVTGVEFGESGETLPRRPHLFQNYPNPFNPSTWIPYRLPARGMVRLDLFDTLGRRVATLIDGEMNAGDHTAFLRADGLATGMYIVRLVAGGASDARKIVLIR